MDIHPVAVIIARVTYLLALAPVIAKRAGSLSIPVYLGDAMQLSTAETMDLKELVIRVPPPPEGTDLKFPEIFCKDIRLFDKLIAQMRQGSEQKPKKMTARQIEQAFQLEIERHYKRDMTKAEADGVREMVATYVNFDKLCRAGPGFGLDLCRAQPVAAAGAVLRGRLGERRRRQSAVGRFSAYERRLAKAVSRAWQTASGSMSAASSRRRTISPRLFTVRAASLYLRSGGRHRIRPAACRADARPVREIAQRLILQPRG